MKKCIILPFVFVFFLINAVGYVNGQNQNQNQDKNCQCSANFTCNLKCMSQYVNTSCSIADDCRGITNNTFTTTGTFTNAAIETSTQSSTIIATQIETTLETTPIETTDLTTLSTSTSSSTTSSDTRTSTTLAPTTSLGNCSEEVIIEICTLTYYINNTEVKEQFDCYELSMLILWFDLKQFEINDFL